MESALRLGYLTGDPSSKYSNEHTNLSTEANVPTPRYGQYLTHAHSHITPVVAAMDDAVRELPFAVPNQHLTPVYGGAGA